MKAYPKLLSPITQYLAPTILGGFSATAFAQFDPYTDPSILTPYTGDVLAGAVLDMSTADGFTPTSGEVDSHLNGSVYGHNACLTPTLDVAGWGGSAISIQDIYGGEPGPDIGPLGGGRDHVTNSAACYGGWDETSVYNTSDFAGRASEDNMFTLELDFTSDANDFTLDGLYFEEWGGTGPKGLGREVHLWSDGVHLAGPITPTLFDSSPYPSGANGTFTGYYFADFGTVIENANLADTTITVDLYYTQGTEGPNAEAVTDDMALIGSGTKIPEPSSAMLAGLALALAGSVRRRRTVCVG